MRYLLLSFAWICALTTSAQYAVQKLDINIAAGSGPNTFTSFKGKTYFVANDSVHGNELWWSDGYSYGLVADINPGAASAFEGGSYQTYNEFCVAAGKLFFQADDGVHGTEIYEYDGVNAPRLTADLDTGTLYGFRWGLVELKGHLYFIAATAANGYTGHLFHYNTLTHAFRQTDVTGILTRPVVVNNKLVMRAWKTTTTQELYEYDPTGDTLTVVELWASGLDGLHVYRDALYFMANTPGMYGYELYTYNGFSPPRRITDIAPNQGNSLNWAMTDGMAMYNNRLYFMATDGALTLGYHLYSYDPATDSVRLEKKMNSYTSALKMAVYSRKLYIACDSGYGMSKGMFVYDGNELTRFNYQQQQVPEIPLGITESNGHLYYADIEKWPFNHREPYVLTDSAALGADAPVLHSLMAVYPNPAGAELNIPISLRAEVLLHVQLSDMQGRVVYTSGGQRFGAGVQKIIVPMHELAPGNYMYSVKNGEGEILQSGTVTKE